MQTINRDASCSIISLNDENYDYLVLYYNSEIAFNGFEQCYNFLSKIMQSNGKSKANILIDNLVNIKTNNYKDHRFSSVSIKIESSNGFLIKDILNKELLKNETLKDNIIKISNNEYSINFDKLNFFSFSKNDKKKVKEARYYF